MHLVERVASGIPRMREAMVKAGLPEPKFETRGFFTIILNRPEKNGTINGTVNLADKIVSLLEKEDGLSAPELVNRTGKGLRTIKRYLDTLKKEGKIEFRGAPKTGGYYLKDRI